MAFALGPEASAAGYRVVAFDTIGSTSAEALARAEAGDPGRLWVVARAQTAGRGRRGRQWETPEGNLAASLIAPAPADAALAATLGFAAGLALEQAIRAVAPDLTAGAPAGASHGGALGLRLKWPNDLLLDGAKVAGILLQAAPPAGGRRGDGECVVIGFGVNVRQAPVGLPYPATSLAARGSTVEPEALFTALSDAWIALAALWDGGRGFAAVRQHWLRRAAGLGEPIAIDTGGGTWRGVFDSIDESGMLVIKEQNGGLRRIAAGDVHFGAVATARQ